MAAFNKSGDWQPHEVADMIEALLGEDSVVRTPDSYTQNLRQPWFGIDCGSPDAAREVCAGRRADDFPLPRLQVGTSSVDFSAHSPRSIFFQLNPNIEVRCTQIDYLKDVLLPKIIELRKDGKRPTAIAQMAQAKTFGTPLQEWMPPEERAALEAANMRKYGDKSDLSFAARSIANARPVTVSRRIQPDLFGGKDVDHNASTKAHYVSDREKQMTGAKPTDRYYDPQSEQIVTKPGGYMLKMLQHGVVSILGPGTFYDKDTTEYRELTAAELATYQAKAGPSRE